jgi:RNA polymerase sigma-54 factor
MVIVQSQNLGVSLEQGLRVNQQMLHSIRLMEMPVMELRERIEEELSVNPALDVAEEARSVREVQDVRAEALREAQAAEDNGGDFFETAAPLYSYNASQGGDDENRQFLEGAVSRPESLQDQLLWQFRLQKVDEDIRRIGELLIGNLDDDGFHLVPPSELLVGEDPVKVKAALSVIQALDPQGCATTDYRESLAVQGGLRFGDERGIKALLPYLGDLEKGRFPLAAKQAGMTALRAELLFARIKELSPFPGRQHFSNASSGTGVRLVVPDIEVHRKGGELSIKLNDEEIPVLRVSPFFIALKKYKSEDQKMRDFVNENVAGARWFINAIHRRNGTLLRVMHAIAERQKAFFEKGPAFIVPLTQIDIAESVGLGTSTISRTANGKYVQTEWGIYEISHFFSNAVTGLGPQDSQYSKAGVKELIKEIIAKAEKRTSDSEIARLLEARGVKIARRTVAKYRNELENG